MPASTPHARETLSPVSGPGCSATFPTGRVQGPAGLGQPGAYCSQPGLANQLDELEDGWVRISPYGDFPKERPARQPDGSIRYERFLQRVDRAAAQVLAREFSSLLASGMTGGSRRFRVGAPIYKGHPDVEEAAERYPDSTRYGMISALQDRPDGLYGQVVLAEEAQAIISRDGLKWLSPFWLVRLTGQDIDGVPVCTPVKLLSAGLTRSPNIRGGQPLANEKQTHPMEKTILIALLGLANDATDEQIQFAITGLKDQAAQITSLLVQLENENAVCQSRLRQERQARISLLLEAGLNSGRITPGERAAWEQALSNEDQFEARAAEMSRLAPRIKTSSVTGSLGQRQAALENEPGRRSALLALVAEKQAKGLAYDDAFAAVQRENPELLLRMKQPARE